MDQVKSLSLLFAALFIITTAFLALLRVLGFVSDLQLYSAIVIAAIINFIVYIASILIAWLAHR